MKLPIILIAAMSLPGCKQRPKEVDPLPQPNKPLAEKTIVLQLRAGGKVSAGDHKWKGNIDSTLREAIRIYRLDNNDPVTVVLQVDSVVAYGFVHRLMKVASGEKAKVTVNILQR